MMFNLHVNSINSPLIFAVFNNTETLKFMSFTTSDYITNKEDVDISWLADTELHKPDPKRINTSAGLS